MKYDGLSSNAAALQLGKFGYNELNEQKTNTWIKILFRQIKSNFMVYMLVFAAILSFIVGKSFTAIAILTVLFVIVFVGFFQEYRADKAIKSLKKMIMPVSIVIRDGKEIEIPSRELVPGDIVLIRSGEIISADGVILKQISLQVDESILTGESRTVSKENYLNKEQNEKNTLFMGTNIINGKCIIQIIHTGMNTRFGKIAGLISSAEKPMPLQKKINRVVRYMIGIAFFITFITGIFLISKNWPLTDVIIVDILITLIALLISAFPEGLPVVFTTTLAAGARRMAGQKAIVNRMSIIETLGEATVICTDKTGTITKGEMTVKKIFCDNKTFDVGGVGFEGNGDFFIEGNKINPLNDDVLLLLLRSAVICNDSRITRKGTDLEYNILGSSTEAALLVMASKANIFRDDLNPDRTEEIPFSSESKIMGVLVNDYDKDVAYVKGAPEILLSDCSHFYQCGKKVKLSPKEIIKIMKKNLEFNEKGFRTIAFAFNDTNSLDKSIKNKDLVFIGLAAIDDPPREEVANSIKMCKQAGIEVKMITGDNVNTAIVIGKQVGIIGKTMQGEELDKITDDELSRIVNDIAIFARVKPEHKLRIVKALKTNGEIVVMTGDGVNDAPSLKEAHIGVAMGIKGTDVSRGASDLILKDDNFITIVSAIIGGRTIFSNIRKFVAYQLSCNFAELSIIFVGLLVGLPLPLLGIQILFMNLVTDDLPAIMLGFNPASKDVMKKKSRKESIILDKEAKTFLITSGIIMATGTLFVFWLALDFFKLPVVEARTVALVTLIFFEVANAFNYRSFRKRFFENKISSNKLLLYASIASILATIAIVHTPLNIMFETTPIHPIFWLLALCISFSVIITIDQLKFVLKRMSTRVTN